MARKAEKTNEPNSEILFAYGDEVAVLPLATADVALRASSEDLRILIYLAADRSARIGDDAALGRFAEEIGVTLEAVHAAIAFWKGAGILTAKEQGGVKRTVGAEKRAESVKAPSETAKEAGRGPEKGQAALQRADTLPTYTTEELAALLEERKHLSLFVDECQRAYGKIFNPRDVNTVLTMVDYLSLSEEYVLTLLEYFGELSGGERKSLHYLERMAISLCNEGITTVDALNAHLARIQLLRDNEGKIRSIFGMGSRSLTAKEQKEITKWLSDYGYDVEIIRLAYERTVNATGKPSVSYASKILERWHSEGMKTAEEVVARESATQTANGNFETNDFFEAALRRSYGDSYEADVGKRKGD